MIQNTHGFTDGAHRRRRDAEDPRRAERQHGVDQAARHQRRRLLQRQLRAPVLEPDEAQRLPRALRDPHHPVRARVHVRADGQGQAPGLRGVRGDARALARRSAWCAIFARSRRQPEARHPRRDPDRHRDVTGRQRRGQGGALRPGRVRLVGRLDDGHVERVGQLDARQLHAARRHGRASCT